MLTRTSATTRPSDQDDDLDDDEDPDVEPERLEDVGEGLAELLDVEELLADVGPARAGQDQRREPAEDDDRRDRRDRGAATIAAARLAARALGAAIWLRVTTGRSYSSVATPPPALIQRCWIFASSPELSQLVDRRRDAVGQSRVLLEQRAPLVAAREPRTRR